LKINIDSEIENLKFKEAIDKVFKELTQANQKIEKEKPWELYKNKKTKELEDLFYNPLTGIVFVILASSQALEPFMPGISHQITQQVSSLEPQILFKKIEIKT
jgi:methionyl-tRNA synthetase